MKIIGTIVMALALAAAPHAFAQTPAAKTTQAAAPKIVIYHAEGRRSERIVWLCEELGVPYELKYRRGDVAGHARRADRLLQRRAAG
jgi:glutathione S-transferase